MHIDFLVNAFSAFQAQPAVIWQNQAFSYDFLHDRLRHGRNHLQKLNLAPGSVVGLEGDFSPNGIGLFLALIEARHITVPLSSANSTGNESKIKIGEVEHLFKLSANDEASYRRTSFVAKHQLYQQLRDRNTPGLVLFSSGTSGQPKAAVHDFSFLLEKFKHLRKALCTINFLLFDHWGGLNTMLHTLSNGGTVVTLRDRSPETVCQAIQAWKVELLPATPTFLNLLLMSRCFRNFDLSSLKLITYGAEPMPQSTLKRLSQLFPGVKLQQTYGLIEVGVLRSQSRENDSLWVKIGGDGYETRVVDGILQIKTRSAILGYLNAPAPFTDDGWFITGDSVEQDGEYFLIHGRKSELINVGGNKVYPNEVEDVIYELDGVLEAVVFGERNPVFGSIVCARVRLCQGIAQKAFEVNLKRHCRQRLEKFKVPVKIIFDSEIQHGDRFKKLRSAASG